MTRPRADFCSTRARSVPELMTENSFLTRTWPGGQGGGGTSRTTVPPELFWRTCFKPASLDRDRPVAREHLRHPPGGRAVPEGRRLRRRIGVRAKRREDLVDPCRLQAKQGVRA